LEALLKFGADIVSKDRDGRTAPHKADVNCTDKNALTPHCCSKRSSKFLEALLKFGADIDSKDRDGRTAPHIAAKEGHEQIVIALLEHGCDINIMSKSNHMPIGYGMAGVISFHNGVGIYYDVDDYDQDSYYYNYYHHHHHQGGRTISDCENVADIVTRIIVKMKSENLFVSKNNLLSNSGNVERSDVQNECEEEIAGMKSENVSNANVSFYDILTKGKIQLAVYAGNENVVQILRSGDHKVKFPIYDKL
jgi:hypothetical protein